jgi:ribonuclease VapC
VIVDSSAIIALVLREPGWERVFDQLRADDGCAIGAPTLLETGIVLTAKLGKKAPGILARVLQEASISVVPFTDDHWRVAVDAYARFGKGRHAAALNFGDCLTYAIARLADRPLLFVGDDFARTDLAEAR